MPGMFDRETQVYKGYRNGAHRLVSPEETFERAWKLAPAMGITRVANVTGLDQIGIPVVMVVRPNSRSISVSQGKGLTLQAAKASGLMEAIEGFHAENILLPLKHGSYRDLVASHRLANIWRLPRARSAKLDEHTPLFWIKGYDLINDVEKWLPYEVVHTNYTTPFITGKPIFAMTSNGLASGNHLLEATVHAINEIAERDAGTLWHLRWREPQEHFVTRVSADSITSSSAQQLLQQLDDAGMDVYIFNQTSDTGLPTFRCEIFQREQNPFQRRIPYAGLGTHLTREIALIRAITEAAQSRLVFIAGVRDDLDPALYNVPDLDESTGNRREASTQYAGTGVNFEDIPDYQSMTFNADLDYQLEALKSVGIDEVIVVDLTRPEFKLPVVRVVIPGLEMTFVSGKQYTIGERAQRILEQS